jgi:predicted short-subunit dehydrogenase-like oxidoreductase (DUF2520 family)
MIGSGNMATQLGNALAKKGFNIRQVYSYTLENAEKLADQLNAYATNNLADIQTSADLYIIAVKDAVLHQVIEHLPQVKGIVTHTAGSMSMDLLLRFDKHGIIYPFQTFTKEREVDFSVIPILLETSDEEVYNDLKVFAKKISQTVIACDSNQRRQIHLAAVFACNFANHMYAIADGILQKNNISFDVIKPLIKETAEKVQEVAAENAQTGPAIRGDQNVIDKHLKLLSDDAELSALYRKLTNRIQRI